MTSRTREPVKAILVLPGTALVHVPIAILWVVSDSPAATAPARVFHARVWIGALAGALGFALASWEHGTTGRARPSPI